jgi:hypothetical protein
MCTVCQMSGRNVTGEDPPPLAVSGDDFALLAAGLLDDSDRGVPQRQDDAVVEAVDDLLQRVAQGDEIDHVPIGIKRTFDLAIDVVVVPVDRLANVAAVGDEVSRAEDEAFFLDADAVGFDCHGAWSI